MGFGICQICAKKDFIYKFRPNIYPYFLFCDNCSKRLLIKHHRILRDFHLLFVREIFYPEYKGRYMKLRYEMGKKIKILIYE